MRRTWSALSWMFGAAGAAGVVVSGVEAEGERSDMEKGEAESKFFNAKARRVAKDAKVGKEGE